MNSGLVRAGLLACSLSFAPFALAQPAAFFKGRTVNVIAPTDTGGSVYEYTLLVSNHLGRHLPGGARTVAQTRPGGGGVTASNFMARNAPKDGSAIALISFFAESGIINGCPAAGVRFFHVWVGN